MGIELVASIFDTGILSNLLKETYNASLEPPVIVLVSNKSALYEVSSSNLELDDKVLQTSVELFIRP